MKEHLQTSLSVFTNAVEMETLELYVAEDRLHKFSVYCDPSIDFSARPGTQCAHRMTSSLAVMQRFFVPPHCRFYCGNIYFTTTEPHILC